MSEYTLETHAEYGDAFGECATEIFFDFEPATEDTRTDPGTDARAIINGGRFYSNGRHVYLDGEEANNVSRTIEDDCIEWANQKQADAYDQRADYEYERSRDARLERE
jgi:hypothetical protein